MYISTLLIKLGFLLKIKILCLKRMLIYEDNNVKNFFMKTYSHINTTIIIIIFFSFIKIK